MTDASSSVVSNKGLKNKGFEASPSKEQLGKCIVILDFGSQYTQLIARRVREMGVFSLIFPYDANFSLIRDAEPAGIILSGGPESVHESADVRLHEAIFAMGCPLLGICYGMHTMAVQLGGEVEKGSKREFGHARVKVNSQSALLETALIDAKMEDVQSADESLDVWMSHGDKVTKLPEGFICTASSQNAPVAAMEHPQRNYYAIQFHPEVTHTRQGLSMLKHFVIDICDCEPKWTAEHIIDNAVAQIRQKVGSDKVLLGLSGGVDSAVAAALIHRAIGENLVCVFVDHGLLRLNESVEVMRAFKQIGLAVDRVEASETFMQALQGVSEPEEKRKIIGREFISVFDKTVSASYPDVKWLAQGTIYPDVIESAGAATGKAHVIKSHHNVGGLPDYMSLKLVEPLRDLFKDEVRKIGTELGLPKSLIGRHPFPGPGLGVRILGEIKQQYVTRLQQADDIFISLLRSYGWYDKVSQALAVYLPVSSVGVMGDQRRYEHVIALRAVETVDFMTAKVARLPYELIEEASTKIVNEVDGISRVVYDISSKPPATIEWE